MVSLNYTYWDQWLNPHKVTFDGLNKRIIINPGVASLNVKQDVYSDWKEWVQQDSNAKFLPALRTIGGDPVGGGQYAGDMYFLTNGWRVVVNHMVSVVGILYNDSGETPFIITAGGGVSSTVSSLAYAYSQEASINTSASPSEIAEAVWGHTQ